MNREASSCISCGCQGADPFLVLGVDDGGSDVGENRIPLCVRCDAATTGIAYRDERSRYYTQAVVRMHIGTHVLHYRRDIIRYTLEALGRSKATRYLHLRYAVPKVVIAKIAEALCQG